jgi:hypothetical protein
MHKTQLLAALILLSSLSLTGCGGGGASIETNATGTYGQQLIDLKAAYDKGLLTQKEYENAAEDIKDKMDD